MARINLDLFSARWANMTTRFGLNPDDQVFAMYYEELSQRLTDEQFAIAAKRVILEETFFPSAKTLWEKVIVSPDESAAIHWANILDSAHPLGKYP